MCLECIKCKSINFLCNLFLSLCLLVPVSLSVWTDQRNMRRTWHHRQAAHLLLFWWWWRRCWSSGCQLSGPNIERILQRDWWHTSAIPRLDLILLALVWPQLGCHSLTLLFGPEPSQLYLQCSAVSQTSLTKCTAKFTYLGRLIQASVCFPCGHSPQHGIQMYNEQQ